MTQLELPFRYGRTAAMLALARKSVREGAAKGGVHQRARLVAFAYLRGMPYARCEPRNHLPLMYTSIAGLYGYWARYTRRLAAEYLVAWEHSLLEPAYETGAPWRSVFDWRVLETAAEQVRTWAAERDK